MQIKNLFDPQRDIYRTIEKVISYNASQQQRLKSEIAEYEVTDNIEEQFEKLLSKMQLAMESGGENDIGVWVSGFYGSGKSSLTKYLGLAFDDSIKIDGISFLEHLQNRFHKPQTKALLSTVAKRFPAKIVLLDLATDDLTGAKMEDISTVLYYKSIQLSGYSQNLKVYALERKLQKEKRYDEFKDKVHEITGESWETIQNDPLVVDSIIPEIAHEFYPQLFKTSTSFSTDTGDFFRFESDRVQEMINIIREKSGKQYIIFIIDEVGHYVASRQHMILNLDGLAKNLKNYGDGKVWIMGTAQQTLTEDDPKAAINSPELYKLKDRFPIQINLESSDIREICYRRLLGKSTAGAKSLEELFTKYGPALRHNTKLQDAKYYDSDFNKETFVNLYPFLPAHFDILLHLLGALAKSTGGYGLRSAIKVIQDILIEGSDGKSPVAERDVGYLATTVTLFDALEKDIQRAFPSIHQSVEKVVIRFKDSQIHHDVAKTVAVLQILANLPVTPQNITGLMHIAIEQDSQLDEIKKVIEDLNSDAYVPFGEQDGNYCFFSEKLNDIEMERSKLIIRSMETRRIFNEALKEVFSPLPSTRIHGNFTVVSGVKSVSGSSTVSIDGERNTIQTFIEFVGPADYETTRTRLVDDSRLNSSKYSIFLIGRTVNEINERLDEIYRCREISKKYKNDPDKEVKDYCKSQMDRADKLSLELAHLFKQSMVKGSFIFRGQTTAAESLNSTILEASKKHLATVAELVFERYAEAPIRVETSLAEKFLKVSNLSGITNKIDPLNLVTVSGGTPNINADYIALISIKEYIERNGTVEGKRLIEHFSDAPFGWSPDTLRYLLAALLTAGEIKLKVSGRDVTVKGQHAIDGLKTNNTFKSVGVSLRMERPSTDVLARASDRLTDLLGEMIVPLEDDISKAVTKHLAQFQAKYAPIAEKLISLGLPGDHRIESLSRDIADMLSIDGSDAPQRFGSEESLLYDNLKWAGKVKIALEHGLDDTIKTLIRHQTEIESLPGSGIPAEIKEELDRDSTSLKERLAEEDFYRYTADLSTALSRFKAVISEKVQLMVKSQRENLQSLQKDLTHLPDWNEFTEEEQNQVLGQLDDLATDVAGNLDGLKQLLNQEYSINTQVAELKRKITFDGQDRRKKRIEAEREKAKKEGKTTLNRSIKIPATIKDKNQLDSLIKQLQELKNELAIYHEIEISIDIEE